MLINLLPFEMYFLNCDFQKPECFVFFLFNFFKGTSGTSKGNQKGGKTHKDRTCKNRGWWQLQNKTWTNWTLTKMFTTVHLCRQIDETGLTLLSAICKYWTENRSKLLAVAADMEINDPDTSVQSSLLVVTLHVWCLWCHPFTPLTVFYLKAGDCILVCFYEIFESPSQ